MKIKPRYRIVKRYERNVDDDKIKCFFFIEQLGVNVKKSIFFFTKWYKWKPYRVECCMGIDCYKEIVRFDTAEKAQERIGNLLEPVYADEVVK